MLKGVDFFCGAGGMTHGLLQAGVDVVAGVDNHQPCKPTYENVANNERPCGSAPKFIHADVATDDVDALLRAEGIEENDDKTVFAGCSPCQYWSKVNTSKEKSAKSKSLLEHFQTSVDVFRPGYVVIENVSGLSTRRTESGLNEFIDSLKSLGYGLDQGTVAVYRYGVPQKRHRYLLLATRLIVDAAPPFISLPNPCYTGKGYPEDMSVRHFIGVDNGFPSIVAGERVERPQMHWAARLSKDNLKRIKKTKHDGGSRMAWKDDPDLQIEAYRGKDHIFRDVYGRMWWDQPSSTITTRFNSLSNGRFGHPEEDRAISLREGATLQTFPLSYDFPNKFVEAARQIGNAVPPTLSKLIGRHIIDHYATVAVRS